MDPPAPQITGEKLHEEGVVIAEPGQVDLGRSAELHFKITSTERGSFSILAKYLGTVIKEVRLSSALSWAPVVRMLNLSGVLFRQIEFTHEELISLVQDSEASTEYQALAKKLDYSRKGSKLIMARAFSLDVTKVQTDFHAIEETCDTLTLFGRGHLAPAVPLRTVRKAGSRGHG